MSKMLSQSKNTNHLAKDDNFHSNSPFSLAKECNFQIFMSSRDRKMKGRALIKKEGEGFRLRFSLAEFENKAFIAYPRKLEIILNSLLLR